MEFWALFLLVASASAAPAHLQPFVGGAVYRQVHLPAQVRAVETVHRQPPYTVVQERTVHQPPVVTRHVQQRFQKNDHFADVEQVVGHTQEIIKPALTPEAPGATVFNRGAPFVPDHTVVTNHQVVVPGVQQHTVVEHKPATATHVVEQVAPAVVAHAPVAPAHAVVAAADPVVVDANRAAYLGVPAVRTAYVGAPGFAYRI